MTSGLKSTERRYSAIVFGATGFTGQYVVKELFDSKSHDFAIAGRSETGLKNILNKMAPTPEIAAKIGVIIADCKSPESLSSMTAEGQVVLDCVGPYRFFGEPVVKACLSTKTHYLDISGEPQFIESMQLKYHQEALEKGVFIVSACAFDCIPADIGTLFASSFYQNSSSPNEPALVPGTLCSGIESFLTIRTGSLGMAGHYATYESAVHGFADAGALSKIRKELSTQRQQKEKERIASSSSSSSVPPVLKQLGPPLKRHSGPFYDSRVERWCLPFPGADPSVVRRSQQLLSEEEERKEGGWRGQCSPVQYAAYFTLPSFFSLVLFLIFGFFFKILAGNSFGRKLLLGHPKFFTYGIFSHDGPTPRQLKETSFEMTLFTNGYSSPSIASSENNKSKPDKNIVVRVRGPEPGYVATPMFFVQCYKTLIEEVLPESRPSTVHSRGGVLTPAAVFAGSTLVNRLRNRGIDFVVAK